ncbi:hypothetical protein, partial [Escherichia coli]|uniref:hypothetical protein n=1 Tax=Escherichia coli TaxID=562 RepID=UPI00215ADBAC
EGKGPLISTKPIEKEDASPDSKSKMESEQTERDNREDNISDFVHETEHVREDEIAQEINPNTETMAGDPFVQDVTEEGSVGTFDN